MTVVSANLREPLQRFKRLVGVVLVTTGAIVLVATQAWVVAYFVERGVDLDGSFGREFWFWSPVLLFNVPGLLLVTHGARMMRNAPVASLESVEGSALVVSAIAVIGLIAFGSNA